MSDASSSAARALLPLNPDPSWPIVELRQRDFDGGTFIARSNTHYRFVEDVTMHPNPHNDFQPTAQQIAAGVYNAQATQIGFTTSMQIGGHNVHVDLNGFTIQQSPLHYLQQRFFSHFQFGATPFIDKAGPIDLVEGDTFVGPSNVVIRNGHIGRSSHHAIQGNQCTNVLLEDLHISQFEVNAISINLVDEVTIRNCRVGTSNTTIPVVGAYSQGRFLRQFVRKIANNPAASLQIRHEGLAKVAALEAEMDTARDQILSTGHTDVPLFANPSGLSDGSYVGAILIHGRGPAVNDFTPMPAEDDTTTVFCKKVRIHNVDIDDIVGAPKQIVAVTSVVDTTAASGSYAVGVQHDCVGAVLDVMRVWNQTTDEYVPNVLADAQAFLGEFRDLLPAIDAARVTISPGMVRWMRVAGTKLTDVMNEEGTYFSYNGDVMSHVMKGSIAIRLDLVEQCVMQNVHIRNSQNQGEMAGTVDGSTYETSHANQTQLGYQGATARGISFSACRKVRCRNVSVESIKSDQGPMACGIDILNGSDVTFADDSVSISNIVAPRGVSRLVQGYTNDSHPVYGGRPHPHPHCNDDDESSSDCDSDHHHHPHHRPPACSGGTVAPHYHPHEGGHDSDFDCVPANVDCSASSGGGGGHLSPHTTMAPYHHMHHHNKKHTLRSRVQRTSSSTKLAIIMSIIVLILLAYWWFKRRRHFSSSSAHSSYSSPSEADKMAQFVSEHYAVDPSIEGARYY